jgi:multiple sugar transport system permease protein
LNISLTHRLLLNGALVLLLVLVGAPFAWMISASLMAPGGAAHVPLTWIPHPPTLGRYHDLFARLDFARPFLNSCLAATLTTVASLFVNSLAGFAFAKYRFAGRDPLLGGLLAAMVIPGQVTMLPVFLLLHKLGLLNTVWSLVIPGMASVFAIYLFRNQFAAIPDDLIESARIDGANDWQIYWGIMLPLARPILITLGLFTFMGAWNDFLWPLVVMSDSHAYTLPVALANLSGEHQADTELMMAGAVITTLPVVVLFLALQRYYIEGMMAGAVKG